MALILTNDDGIDAPGIKALQKALNLLPLPSQDSGGNEDTIIVIVAPQDHLSGCGHQVTTGKPIEVEQRSESAYAVGGTPADCVRLAISQISDDVEWVLSGINAGGNLGVDVYISGTVAAVREAAILGVKGIAISHWIKRPLLIDWEVATARTARVLEKLMAEDLSPGCFWNVNLPHLEPDAPEPEIVFCSASIDPLPVNYRQEGGTYYYEGEYGKRDRADNTDVDVCFSGHIAVTQLRL
jgi:5'-nucleotidase